MKGLQIAAFVFCFSLSIGLLAGLGWFDVVGTQPDPGIDNTDAVEEEAEEVEAGGESSRDEGILGTIGAVNDVINTLRTLTVQTGSALTNLGVPAPIAYAIHSVVALALLVTMLEIIRGMRFGT
ncbi:hypothetical protein OB905_13205 [Halobacteria archaeon AArc-dxtr1]|nr:hypothetical protein [Halobacteria archaeon AArc-dxtr1]